MARRPNGQDDRGVSSAEVAEGAGFVRRRTLLVRLLELPAGSRARRLVATFFTLNTAFVGIEAALVHRWTSRAFGIVLTLVSAALAGFLWSRRALSSD